MKNERLQYLLGQWMEEILTTEEENELTAYLEQHQEGHAVPELLQSYIEDTVTEETLPVKHRERILSAVLQIDKTIYNTNKDRQNISPISPNHPLRVSFRRWGWFVAAVALLLAEATVVMLSMTRKKRELHAVAHDITPGSSKAFLTLGDGTAITLDSAGKRLIHQGTVTVRKAGAQLIYDVQGNHADVSYNTLTTPRGGQFRVQLPDGTLVWLNAASSLRYPTAFKDGERIVDISGEAYFEVAKHPCQPFKVKVRDEVAVEVTGTHFNVNAYQDEAAINITLLEGAVRVVKLSTADVAVLKAGEQAQIGNQLQSGIKIISNAGMDKVMAWKNGQFNFNDASLGEVVRQLSRWYDLQVVYEDEVPQTYLEGKMSRKTRLPEVLAGLQQTGVQFRIEEGKRLVVMKR